jgi:predicted alpha-1,6-mannanase (GH76 family)
LRKLLIVERDIAQDGLLKGLTAMEQMALQDVFDPAIEPLDHAVCLWPHWWREAMLDAEVSAKLPACEEKSASRIPIPNLAQNRSCHEKRRSARVYVIIRDGTPNAWQNHVN